MEGVVEAVSFKALAELAGLPLGEYSLQRDHLLKQLKMPGVKQYAFDLFNHVFAITSYAHRRDGEGYEDGLAVSDNICLVGRTIFLNAVLIKEGRRVKRKDFGKKTKELDLRALRKDSGLGVRRLPLKMGALKIPFYLYNNLVPPYNLDLVKTGIEKIVVVQEKLVSEGVLLRDREREKFC